MNIKNIEKLLKDNPKALHIFLVSNPIFEMISLMWIDFNKIPMENVIVISTRQSLPKIISADRKYFKLTFLDRVFEKFNFKFYNRRICNFIRSKDRKFFLYSAWHFELVFAIDKLCNKIGNFYIEEGQLSNWNKKLFTSNDLQTIKLQKKLYAEDREFLHSIKSLGFISIDSEAFSHVDESKRINLTNFQIVKDIYKPSLLGINEIGLTPAFRRVSSKNIEKIVLDIAFYLKNNSCIKIHPGFNISKNNLLLLEELIFKKTKKRIFICNSEIILEAEMLFQKKKIYGPLSSIERYTKILGSEYIYLKLY